MKPLLHFSVLLLALIAPSSHAQTAKTSSQDTSAMLFDASWGDLKESIRCDHRLLSTTKPTVSYTQGRHLAHVTGVLYAKWSVGGPDQPSPDTTVNVIADLGQGFVAFQRATTDRHGVYDVWFTAPAPVQSVSADSPSFVCIVAKDEKAKEARS